MAAVPDSAQALVKKLVTWEPRARLRASDAVAHAWFAHAPADSRGEHASAEAPAHSPGSSASADARAVVTQTDSMGVSAESRDSSLAAPGGGDAVATIPHILPRRAATEVVLLGPPPPPQVWTSAIPCKCGWSTRRRRTRSPRPSSGTRRSATWCSGVERIRATPSAASRGWCARVPVLCRVARPELSRFAFGSSARHPSRGHSRAPPG